MPEEYEGLPVAGEVEGLQVADNVTKLKVTYLNTGLLRDGDKLIQRKGIVEKLESSIRSSIEYRDRHKKGSTLWKRHNHGAHEKIAILRYIAQVPPQDIESEGSEKLLEELLEEVDNQ